MTVDLDKFQRQRLWVIPQARMAMCMTPKAACTSVRYAFHQAYGEPGTAYKDSRHKYGFKNVPGDRVPADFKRVMLVRSPWERLRSCYTEKVTENKVKVRGLREIGVRSDMSFAAFCRLIHALPDEEAEKHVISQSRLVRSPYWGGAVDRFVRFERLAEDWVRLRDMWPELPKTLPRHRITVAAKPAWTAETIRLVAERYAEDIAILGYEAP